MVEEEEDEEELWGWAVEEEEVMGGGGAWRQTISVSARTYVSLTSAEKPSRERQEGREA